MTGKRKPRVVIAGGGVAGIETLLALNDLAGDRIEVAIVAPQPEFVYQPLSVVAPLNLGEPPRFDLGAIALDLGAVYHRDAVTSVDPDRSLVSMRSGKELSYDALVIASGAAPEDGLPGALTYRGVDDRDALRAVIDELEREDAERSIVFAVPSGTTWALPAYELALITEARLRAGGNRVRITLITPEAAPLTLFGRQASDAVADLLASRGVGLLTSTYPVRFEDGSLTLVPEGQVPADRVIALPRLRGRAPQGVPHDADGFIPVDPLGMVRGLPGVHAAGDVTTSSIKQGGVATQQADTVAAAIAARFGAPVDPQPFRPVLRGMLLTGSGAHFMRTEVTGGRGERSEFSGEPLWWPEGKIAGKYLTHYLSRRAQLAEPETPLTTGAIPINVDLASALT